MATCNMGKHPEDMGLVVGDVDSALVTPDKVLTQADYYYYWVYDAKRPSNGSVTIGYYSVDKYTGDVWDTDQKRQPSGEVLLGLQKIIQQSHRINEDTIRNHRHKPF